MKGVLFPSSEYLRERWWHRLAKVALVIWLIGFAVFLLNGLVLEPYASCIRLNYSFGEANRLDCGSGAFSYFMKLFSEETNLGFTLAFFGGFIAIVSLAPGLLYRVVLYVTKGSSWKDAPPNL